MTSQVAMVQSLQTKVHAFEVSDFVYFLPSFKFTFDDKLQLRIKTNVKHLNSMLAIIA